MNDLTLELSNSLNIEAFKGEEEGQAPISHSDSAAGANGAADAEASPPPAALLDSEEQPQQHAGEAGADEQNERDDVEGKLFVGGISWQTSEESLSEYFSKFGTLLDVTLMKDKYTGQPRGFGFIKFDEPAALAAVLAAEHTVDGRSVDVKRAVPKNEAPIPCRAARQTEANKIFVGGLAPAVTPMEFRAYFEGFGAVEDAVVMFDRQTLRSRGFGFVTFADDATVSNVLMKSHEISGKGVEVKRAEPKSNRMSRGGGGGNGMGGVGGRGYQAPGGMGGYGRRGQQYGGQVRVSSPGYAGGMPYGYGAPQGGYPGSYPAPGSYDGYPAGFAGYSNAGGYPGGYPGAGGYGAQRPAAGFPVGEGVSPEQYIAMPPQQQSPAYGGGGSDPMGVMNDSPQFRALRNTQGSPALQPQVQLPPPTLPDGSVYPPYPGGGPP
ncbi:unnamed protein product [Chrysoparadoxa australica]